MEKIIWAGVPKEGACGVVSLAWWHNDDIILKIAKAIDFPFHSYVWKITKENTYFKKQSKSAQHFSFVGKTIRANHLTVTGI